MPSTHGQSGGYGLASRKEANNDGENIEMDDNPDFLCTCGTDNPGDWVECGNRSCAVRWFHFTCVGLEKAPVGLWLCAECKPTLAIDLQTRAPKQNPSNTSLFPNLGRGASALPMNGTPVKKGVAIKKVAPKKEKLRWKGWVEVSETEEEELKKAVEEPWAARILPQQRRSRMNTSGEQGSQPQREVDKDHEAQDENGTDEEPWSTRILPRRRPSNVRIKAVKPPKEAEVVQEAEDRTETDEEPLSTRMLARQGRLRAKLGAKVSQPNGEDAGNSKSTGGTRSENKFSASTRNRPRQMPSSVKPIAEHALLQNRDEAGDRAREEAEYDADQSVYDDTEDEVEMLSPESSDDEIVHEQSVSGDDTESEFEGFSDDEDVMDYASALGEQELTAVENHARHEDTSDDEGSMEDACNQTGQVTKTDENRSTGDPNEAADFDTRVSQRDREHNRHMDAERTSTPQYVLDSANLLLSTAGNPVQRYSAPNTDFGAPSSDNRAEASHMQSENTSVGSIIASEASGDLEYRMIMAGRYPTLGERSTLPRLG